MVFELITGDFLFNPRPGSNHKKNDDHLALFMEMLGPMPKSFALKGSMFEHYFRENPSNGKFYFRRIHDLKSVNLERLLIYRYFLKVEEARALADFLMTILKWEPKERPSAQKMLEHPWLAMEDNYSYRMSEMEFKLFELKDQVVQVDSTGCDEKVVFAERAELINQQQSHSLQLDDVALEELIESQRKLTGNSQYVFPGQLADDDDQVNGGDSESVERVLKPLHADMASEIDSWGKGGSTGYNSDHSFSSAKMVDGYKEFYMESMKHVKESGSPKKDSPLGSPRKRRDSSASLTARRDAAGHLVSRQSVDDRAEFDLNISFSGGYVPNTDLSRVDKGQGNPQFSLYA